MLGVHLNEEGRQQATALSKRLKDLPISAIYASLLERAIETATPLAEAAGLQVNTSPHFNELDFGEWTNKRLEDLVNEEAFKLFNLFRSNTRIPGGETMMEAQLRIVGGIQQLTKTYTNDTVVIVSHGDIIKAAIAYFAGIPIDLMQRLEISPASVSIIEIFYETCRLALLNDTGRISF